MTLLALRVVVVTLVAVLPVTVPGVAVAVVPVRAPVVVAHHRRDRGPGTAATPAPVSVSAWAAE